MIVRSIAIGALWGLGLGGLFTPRLAPAHQLVALALGLVLGAALAAARPAAEAFRHPVLAVAAAVCGLVITRQPEPTFFLLVPLLAAAVAWPFGPAPDERPLPRWIVPALFAAAAGVFFLQSANRHWTFASGGRDLGLFYQTHWLMAHGQPLLNTVMGMPVLADHMTFDDFLVAPLLRLHDSATTLLLVQALAVASAVFPLYGLGARLLGRPRGALALPLAWVLAPDVHMGVMFDYNQTPFASALLAWTAWALLTRGPVAVLVTALLACAAKDDICLYVALMAAVLALRGVSGKRSAAVVALALGLFAVEIGVLFPWYREGGFRHWEFEELGAGPKEIATAMVTRPWRVAELLVDHPQKRRSLLLPLVTAGYVPAADPVILALQLPNWGERFLSTHRTRWWGYYYGMPALATALVGLVFGWRRLQAAGRAGPGLPRFVVLCALLPGLIPPYRGPDGDLRSPLYSLRRPYAAEPEDVVTQEHAVAFIGRDPRLRVAAQYHLLPHLAGRPYVYELDHAREADVVALQLDGGTWPDGRATWRTRVQETWATGRFHVAFCERRTVVLYRGPEPGVPCPAWAAFLGGTEVRGAAASPE